MVGDTARERRVDYWDTGGVVKARDFRRKPESGGRRGNKGVGGLKGVPWEPYPGAGGGYEIKSTVRLPAESGELAKIVKGKDGLAPWRLRIKKEDLEKFGFATGCPVRRAANRGSTAVGHSEECRKRIGVQEVGRRRDHKRE